MDQNELNKEKQELMERIKDKCCLDRNVYKWVFIILAILVVVYAIMALVRGTQVTASGIVHKLVFVFWPLLMLILWRRGVAIARITDARELLSCYDKYEGISWVCFALLITSCLVIDFDYVEAICIGAFVVILYLAIWRFGRLQDKNIKRLKELVKEEEMNEAKV